MARARSSIGRRRRSFPRRPRDGAGPARRRPIARNLGADCSPGMPRGDNSQTVRATLGLRELLFDGEISPASASSSCVSSIELGVSRTPLRLALVTLEHEGLVETLPGGGFAVREFTRATSTTRSSCAASSRARPPGSPRSGSIRRTSSSRCARTVTSSISSSETRAWRRSSSTTPERGVPHALRGLAKSPQLARELEHVLALPFGPPSALLMVGTRRCRSRGRSSLVAQHQHQAIIDAIRRRARARARTRSPASTHGSRAEPRHRAPGRHAREPPGAQLLNVDAVALTESLEAALARTGALSPCCATRRRARPSSRSRRSSPTGARAARVARDVRAPRPVAPHDRPVLRGPDALRLLSDLGVNRFATFHVGRAKQFIAVNTDGYLIGDAILFHLEQDSFDLVGWRMAIDWVRFHLETGGLRGRGGAGRATRCSARARPRSTATSCRARTALAGHGAAARRPGAGDPVLRHRRGFTIAGHRGAGAAPRDGGPARLRALRPVGRGRAGARGDPRRGRGARPRAGRRAGRTRRANLESGWVPSPLPAIFDGEASAAYREWLPAARAGSLGGSLASDDIHDYYLTPYDLGYGTDGRVRPRLRRPRRARAARRRSRRGGR